MRITCPDETEEPRGVGNDDMSHTCRIFADHTIDQHRRHLRVEVGIFGILTIHQHAESHSLRVFIIFQSAGFLNKESTRNDLK